MEQHADTPITCGSAHQRHHLDNAWPKAKRSQNRMALSKQAALHQFSSAQSEFCRQNAFFGAFSVLSAGFRHTDTASVSVPVRDWSKAQRAPLLQGTAHSEWSFFSQNI
jgi:hypothetical protein